MTGSAVVGHDINTAANESIDNTTFTTVALVVIILLIVYRSPLLAMVPLVTIALSVLVSLRSIALLTTVPALGFQVINITHVFVIVVLFGAGTDYCLFLIARYPEELNRGRPRIEALREAIAQVGGALVAVGRDGDRRAWGCSSSPRSPRSSTPGPTIAMSLAIALAASLTLAPALLALLRGAIFWPFRADAAGRARPATGEVPEPDALPTAGSGCTPPTWSSAIRSRSSSVCLVALLPLAVLGAAATSELQPARRPRRRPPERDRLRRSIRRYFAVGELSPAAVLVENPTLDFRSDRGRAAIAEVSRPLQGARARRRGPFAHAAGRQAARRRPDKGFLARMADEALRRGAESRYVSLKPADPADIGPHHPVRHRLQDRPVLRGEPGDARPRPSGRSRRPRPPVSRWRATRSIGLAGSTSMVNDLRRVTTSDQRRMYVLITLGVYAILVLLLRRPGICLYLIATVVLGYLASLGLTDLVFKALHRGPEPRGAGWTGRSASSCS